MPVLDIVVAALAAVLVVSGVLKVRDPEATVPMLAAVGLPAARRVVYAVAAAEIVVGAVALLIGGRPATLVLGVLYAGFAVVSLLLLRSGDQVSCGCFGHRSATMTPLHVAVNGAAAVVALAAVVLGAPGLYAPGDDRSAVAVAVATVAALLFAAVVVALLTGSFGRIGGRRTAVTPDPLVLESAPVGSGAGATALVAVVGVDVDDEPVTVAVAGTGRVTLLAFLTAGCTTCTRFWDRFAEPGGVALPGVGTELLIVTRGSDQENPNRIRELAPADHRVVSSSGAWRDYRVTAGPYFVLADGRTDRILGEGTATAWGDVAALVSQAVAAGATDAPAPSSAGVRNS